MLAAAASRYGTVFRSLKTRNSREGISDRGELMNSADLLVVDIAEWEFEWERMEPLVRALRRHIGRRFLDRSYIYGRCGSPLPGDNREQNTRNPATILT